MVEPVFIAVPAGFLSAFMLYLDGGGNFCLGQVKGFISAGLSTFDVLDGSLYLLRCFGDKLVILGGL